MEFIYSFKNMEASDALKEYTQQKVGKELERFVAKLVSVQVTFQVSNNDHIIHLSVKGGDNFSLDAEATSENMYASIDKVAAKLDSQLRRQKAKIKGNRRRQGRPMGGDWGNMEYTKHEIDAGDIAAYESALKNRRAE